MRKETTKDRIVRPSTTGYVEADMLGLTFSITEEMSAKQNTSQRPHREGMIVNKQTGVLKWFQTAPTACLRSIRDRISKMRKQKRNGN